MANKLEFIIKLKDEFSGGLSGIVSKLPSLGTAAAAAGAGIAAASAALWKMTTSAADAYDKVNDLSNRLGMTTEFISRMNYAAQMSGVSQEEMATSLRMVSVKLGEASMGATESKKSFDALGISIYDASGKVRDIEEMMPELAQGFANLDSSAQRAALAQELFGRSGSTMIPILTEGKDGLQDLWKEAEKFGLVISTQAADNAAEFNDAMDRMKGAVTGVKNKLVEDLFPVFSQGMNSMANIIADNRETISRWAGVVVEYLGKAAEFTAYAGGVIVDAFRGIHAVWELTKGGLAQWVSYFFEAIGKITGKVADFMTALNFKGIFDGPIAKARSFQNTMYNVGDSVGAVADQSAKEVAEYWEAGMGRATGAVKGFVEKFKAGMSETIPSTGSGKEGEGHTVSSPDKGLSDKEKEYQAAYDNLLNLHQQYTLSEEEQLQAWYDKQAEIFAGHSDAMLLLDETFYAQKNEMQAAQQEAVNAAWEEAVLSDEEKLALWYERQLEMYEGNAIAKAQIDQIYDAKNKALQKKRDDDAAKNRQTFYTNMETIGRAFGKKAYALAQAIAVPEAIINAYRAASNALADVRPYPLNIVAAAAALAQGFVQVANIRAVASGIAHGGLTTVPKEQTYLLDRGERVLSPRQNEDLTEFLEGQAGGGVTIENVTLHILENATDLDVLRGMDKADWQDIVYEKVVPALNELRRMGVKT